MSQQETPSLSKYMGQLLLHFGIAFITATGAYIIQLEGIETRLKAVESHVSSPHPGKDYRALQDEKIRNIQSNLRSHVRELSH